MGSALASQLPHHHRKLEPRTSSDRNHAQTREPQPHSGLNDLPTELLDEISSHLPNISSVAALQATSKRLAEYVRLRGYKSYIRTHYPHVNSAVKFPLPSEIQDLERLEDAWQAESFICHRIRPLDHQNLRTSVSGRPESVHGPGSAALGLSQRGWPDGQYSTHQAYTPALLCFDDTTNDGSARSEVLGVAAGFDLFFMKTVSRRDYHGTEPYWTKREAVKGLGNARHDIFAFQKIGEEIQGVSTTKVLFSHTNTSDIVLIDPKEPEKTLATYGIGGNVVSRSILVPPRRSDFFVVKGDEGSTSLFRTGFDASISQPGPQFDVQPISKAQDPNSSRLPAHVLQASAFINAKTLVLADSEQSGQFKTFSITESGLQNLTITPSENQFVDATSGAVSAVKRIEQAHNPDQVFLVGRASGRITMHDLRTLSTREVFRCGVDPTASIYCFLETTGSRILAGSGRNQNIKIFDLRKTGQVWDNVSLPRLESEAYALYPKSPNPGDSSGSIYSLASSSITSPTIYIGLKGRVLQLDITSLVEGKRDWRTKFHGGFSDHTERWNLSIAYPPNEKGLGMRLKDIGPRIPPSIVRPQQQRRFRR